MIFCDIGKLYEIQNSVCINKVLWKPNHSHHLHFIYDCCHTVIAELNS
jgi:hypothetical protein